MTNNETIKVIEWIKRNRGNKDTIVTKDIQEISKLVLGRQLSPSELVEMKQRIGIHVPKIGVLDDTEEIHDVRPGNQTLTEWDPERLVRRSIEQRQALHSIIELKDGTEYTIIFRAVGEVTNPSRIELSIIKQDPNGKQSRILTEMPKTYEEAIKMMKLWKSKVRDSTGVKDDAFKDIQNFIKRGKKSFLDTNDIREIAMKFPRATREEIADAISAWYGLNYKDTLRTVSQTVRR